MRPERFDEMSRAVANGFSRRRVVKLLAVGSVGGVVLWNTLPSEAATNVCGVQTIWVWANVFIPRDMPWLTRTVPAGFFAGQTMMPAPPGFPGCFLTDQRSFDDTQGFDDRSHPSSRVVVVAQIDVVNAQILQQYKFSSGTIHVNCTTGDLMCEASAPIEGPGFHAVEGASFALRSFASVPCPPGLPAPDLDTDLVFTFVRGQRGTLDLTVRGAIEVFPAWEVYARADGAVGASVLFQHFPDRGRVPGDLVTSQLGVRLGGRVTLDNDQTCDPGARCCPPAVNGAAYCCQTGWSCCGDTRLANRGCCPPDQPLCCRLELGGGCCPQSAPLCCPGETPGCCPQSHPICSFHPVTGLPSCARPRPGVTAAQARSTDDFESYVPAITQSR